MKSVLIPDEEGGTRLVPMVVVVPERTADAIAAVAQRHDLGTTLNAMCERAGWTPEMLIAGRVLSRTFDPTKENTP